MQSHPTLCYPNELIDICNPLNALKIDYFSHVKIDAENRFSAICNNPAFCQYYYENKHYNADIHMAKENKLGDFILWDTLTFDHKSATLAEEAKTFGVKHVFTLVEKNHVEIDYFHFAANVESMQINQSYLANIDLLKLFTKYFKECIDKSVVLKHGHDLKFALDCESNEFSLKVDEQLQDLRCHRSNFLANLNRQQYTSHADTINPLLTHKDTNKTITLTSQQEKCLRLLVAGLSAKQIACQLNISYRTVEHHLAIVKRILGCRNIKEVISHYACQLRF